MENQFKLLYTIQSTNIWTWTVQDVAKSLGQEGKSQYLPGFTRPGLKPLIP